MRHPYDVIAPQYDGLFTSEGDRAEDATIMNIIGDAGSVLDIGCGTGLFLDHKTPGRYKGIDPSMGMLGRLKAKHPAADVECRRFEQFDTAERFDLAVALFGSASYIEPEHLARIPRLLSPAGRLFLMFYRPGYSPRTYARTGVEAKHFPFDAGLFSGPVSEFGDYLIISGGCDAVHHAGDAGAGALHRAGTKADTAA